MGGFVSFQRSPQRRRSWHLVGISIATLSLAILLLLDVGAASSSTSVASNEPTTPILDDFERGLEDPLQQWGNWASTSIDGSGATMEALGGNAGHNEGDVHGDSYRVADIPSGDAEVYGRIASNPSDQRWMYLYLNLQDVGTPGVDGYELRWFHWIAGDGLYLRKLVDGVSTNLVPPVQMSNTDEPGGGDSLLLRRSGGSLEVWHKKAATGAWILRLSAGDSQFQGGKIGFGSDESKARWGDFGGTGSTTPEAPPPILPATDILDAFERPDEDPLSQNGAWSPAPVSGGGETLEVLSLAAGQNEGEVVQANSFRESELAGDAEVHARIARMPENDQVSYLYLHLQQAGTAGFDGYRMRWYHWIVADQLSIEKIIDGVAPRWWVRRSLDPATGDTLLLRREGEALELWRKSGGAWSKLLTSADPSFNSAGSDSVSMMNKAAGTTSEGARPGSDPPPPPPSDEPPAEQSNGICTGSGVHAYSTSRCLSDPVNTLTGAFITQTEDLATAGTGVSFSWSRSYTSSDPTVGRLGAGWTDNYSTSLVEHPTGHVTLHGDEGQQVEYTKLADGSFVGAPGTPRCSRRSPAGTTRSRRPGRLSLRQPRTSDFDRGSERPRTGVQLRRPGTSDARHRRGESRYHRHLQRIRLGESGRDRRWSPGRVRIHRRSPHVGHRRAREDVDLLVRLRWPARDHRRSPAARPGIQRLRPRRAHPQPDRRCRQNDVLRWMQVRRSHR